MRNFLKFSLSAFALMFVLGAFAATDAKAQGPLNEILKRMDAHYDSLQSLRANLKMDKYNPQLKDNDMSEGTVAFLPQKGKDAYIRIDWEKPRAEHLAVIKKEYVLYQPSLKQAMVGKVGSGKIGGMSNALGFLNMSREQLRANYTVRYVGEEKVGSTGTWHIQLTPKTKQNYKLADLWVDKDGMPVMALVTENNNDTMTVVLSNIQKNVNLGNAKDVFGIKLPKDVKIIKG